MLRKSITILTVCLFAQSFVSVSHAVEWVPTVSLRVGLGSGERTGARLSLELNGKESIEDYLGTENVEIAGGGIFRDGQAASVKVLGISSGTYSTIYRNVSDMAEVESDTGLGVGTAVVIGGAVLVGLLLIGEHLFEEEADEIARPSD